MYVKPNNSRIKILPGSEPNTRSSDKDFRLIATNQLLTELQKDSFKLDDYSAREVVWMVLNRLDDNIGPLVNKVNESHLRTIVEILCLNMLIYKEKLYDISSTGLKTVIAGLPPEGRVCTMITGRLTAAIERKDDVSDQLDMLNDLLLKFGPALQNFHHCILAALLKKLRSQRQAVRKRTIRACGNLVRSCDNCLYAILVNRLYHGLCSNKNNSQIRTYVDRQSGHKFGKYVPKFVPHIVQCCEVDDDELRELCLQAFESFTNRCPEEIAEAIPAITDLCLKNLVYDPNYNYDDEEDEENDEFSDDDDMSWRVRRSAAKCLQAIISTRHELLPEFYKVLSPCLIARFKEHDENVKSDIFHAYIALLKQTKSTVNVNMDPNAMEMDEEEENPITLLQSQIELLVRGVQGQMREKSMKTRQDCFHLLKEVCSVLPGALSTHIGVLIPGILYSLSEKNASSNMKIDALSFIYCLLTSHQPRVFHPHISTLLPPVINAVGDSFYKITAEALNVLQELIKVISPLNVDSDFDFSPFTKDIYNCTLVRLKMANIYQEVREKAISTMGQVICNLSVHLKDELPFCLSLFLDRLKNEITRLTTVKVLTKIAGSPLGIELPILPDTMPVLGMFLRKNQRDLKLSTLQLIDSLINNYHGDLNVQLLQPIIAEVPPLLDVSDLHIAQWTLIILRSIATHHPKALQDINHTIMPQVILLVKSPLLYGTALHSMLDFFRSLVKFSFQDLNYDSLLRLLLVPISIMTQSSLYLLAKCVAAITVTCHSQALPVVPQFISEIQTAQSDSQQIFALLVVGEIGREIDLTTVGNLKQVILNSFSAMTSSDKDFRFMATNDLMTELQKDSIKLDDDSERKVVRMLLKLLEDKNGEVQNLAVELIVETLCLNMVSDKEQLRDISSIGLKTVIAELPQAPGGFSGNICKRITGRLTAAIERQDDVSVQLEALDIITDLLLRFGPALQNFHGSILAALLPQLCSQRQAVRKRTISACSNLVLSCNNFLYAKLVDHLYDGLCSDKNNSQIRTYVHRQSGHKFGEYIPKFVPLILQCSEVDDDELREFCLQAFESFINRCPKEITKNIPAITDLCLKYMVYDPNYNYDEDEGTGGQNEGDDDEEDEENDEYSDDDDMSWKVRRSAAKCLEAIISTRHELLPEFYKVLSPCLIARFKEREENVKSDIFHAYIALLKQTKSTVNVNMDPNAMVMDEEEENPITLLQSQIELLVRGVQGQMREKSMKTRQDCFHLLKEVCSVLPGALSTHIGVLIPGILYSLSEKNASSNMKIDALSFIYCLLTSHQPRVFHPHISTLLPPVINAVGDSFYKITAEALNVLQELIKVIRPLNVDSDFDFSPFTKDIYSCTLVRLKTADIDQEVKEKAISTMGQVICNLGDHLKDELPFCLPLFLDRLKNEITRLTTVKALTKIAGSPLGIELPILPDTMPVLGLFLRKNQRALKLSTLQLIDCLINNYHGDLNVQLLQPIIAEVPPLLDESDLHIAQWTLIILRSIATHHPKALQDINHTIMPQVMLLVKSPLLQGTALQSMLDFFKSLVKCNLQGLNYDSLLRLLLVPISNLSTCQNATLHKQAFYSLAKCVAAITVTCHSQALPVVPQFISEIQTAQSDSQQIFALLVVGEIGREIDLTTIGNLKQVILNSFSAVSEEVKSAASYALGSICIGNLQQYLPFILKESQDQPKRQYLLLHSLKEQLYCHCECQEEGTRNVVAECLGKLTLIDPTNLLPKLKRSLNSPSPLMRTTVVTAVKFTISDQRDLIREVEMGPFKHTVDDGLDIRKAAYECMYTLLDSCLDKVDIFEFISHVETGLKDHYDIKMLTYLMVARLSQICPGAVFQKYEKQDELKRSAMRAVAALLSIPDAVSTFAAQSKMRVNDLEYTFNRVKKYH
nr:unnamed protein product [Callosobruchus chinensis]